MVGDLNVAVGSVNIDGEPFSLGVIWLRRDELLSMRFGIFIVSLNVFSRQRFNVFSGGPFRLPRWCDRSRPARILRR